jgi:acyl dehydratase
MADMTIEGLEGLRAAVGTVLGTSSWMSVEQSDIDAFAVATGDHAWMHVDPERAAATPLGSTIAHGLLTLSLGPRCSYEIYEIVGVSLVLNYGFGRVRFPAPVPVGSRVRMRAALVAVEDAGAGVTCTIEQVFERDGGDRPVCVAESLLRVQF